MNIISHITTNRKGTQLLFLLVFCFTLHANAYSFESLKDSSRVKSKFDLNDPRNPNCPCHKQQRLADEEYKKLIAQHKIKSNVSKTDTGNEVKISYHKKFRFSNRLLFVVNTHKNRPKKNHKLIKDITACFHWR